MKQEKMKITIADYRHYLSSTGDLYSPKRLRGHRTPVYALCVRMRRSMQWYQLPGMPVFYSLEEANNKLDYLAGINRWNLCTPQGVKK